MSNNENFQQVLKDLQQKNSERVLNIWIPSLVQGVKFKHLTLNQQKQLIKSSVRENLLKLDFSRNIYSILNENIIDKSVDVDKLNIIDMICIGLAYRSADIGNDYGFYLEDDLYPVDLAKVVEKTRTIDYKPALKTEKIVTDNYHVTVQVPTIKVDKEMNDYLFEKYKNIPDDTESIKDMLADVYICEAAKYITEMDIVSPGDNPDSPPVHVDFTDFTAPQRLKIIEQIPLNVLNQLVSVSDKVQSIESQILDVKLGDETATIEINSAFFT